MHCSSQPRYNSVKWYTSPSNVASWHESPAQSSIPNPFLRTTPPVPTACRQHAHPGGAHLLVPPRPIGGDNPSIRNPLDIVRPTNSLPSPPTPCSSAAKTPRAPVADPSACHTNTQQLALSLRSPLLHSIAQPSPKSKSKNPGGWG